MNGAEMPHVLTTDQKVRSSNLFGRAITYEFSRFQKSQIGNSVGNIRPNFFAADVAQNSFENIGFKRDGGSTPGDTPKFCASPLCLRTPYGPAPYIFENVFEESPELINERSRSGHVV